MMKHLRDKSKVPTVALVLVLTVAATLLCLPAVNAVRLPDRQAYAFVTVSPNPIGQGQRALVIFGITDPTPSDLYKWYDLELTVRKPDGTTESLGTFDSESTGSTYTYYTPAETGTHYLKCSFPEQWLNQTLPYPPFATERLYLADTSDEVALVVQTEQIPDWPPAEVTTDYWDRPIYGENREWYVLGGNFLDPSAGFNQGMKNLYTDAPESPHVMWTREVAFGGIVGGEDSRQYYTGLSYERKWAGIIMQGRVYFNLYPAGFGGIYQTGFACVDLTSGEELWRNEEGRISFGQIIRMETPNQHGNIPYLWGTAGSTWTMYNAMDGFKICDLVDVPGGTMVRDSDGNFLLYRLYTDDDGQRKLSKWSFIAVEGLSTGFAAGEAGGWSWRPPQGGTVNATTGILWTKNVTSVPGNPGVVGISDGVIFCRGQFMDPEVTTHCAYDAETGDLLFAENRTTFPLSVVNFVNTGSLGEETWTEYVKETRQWYAWNIKTGAQKWVTDPYEDQWGMFHGASAIAYGNFYATSYDGRIHCYDVDTGDEKWSYFSGKSGYETPYGHYPFFTFHDAFTIADGKIYAVTGEHSPNDPLYRGEKIHCVDAYTGKGIWNISCWGVPPAIADGYVVTLNHYDNRLYCYGKGPSATTVSASPGVIAEGDSVMITGTVTDQSTAGAGAPCVSEESMEGWMGYLHMQKPIPAEVTGVAVSLDTFDPNGNFIHIGDVTSDLSGMFKKMWTPEIEGEYTIIATFMGSNSYGSSFAETAIGVGPAPEAPPPPPEEPAYTAVDLAIIAAVVVAIVIGIVNLWALRKRT